jgi:hypothetical protein
VRLVCVDLAGVADEVVVDAIARARLLAEASGRILLFGDAAHVASLHHRKEREAREGVWLDGAARWLLRAEPVGNEGPQRPVADVFDERALAVVPRRSDPLALPATDRFLELADGLIVMGVTDESALDVVDNAHLWLIGGAPFAVETRGSGRALVRVGGAVVVVVVERGEAVVTAHALDGGPPVTHVLSLTPPTKMSVRGGDRP